MGSSSAAVVERWQGGALGGREKDKDKDKDKARDREDSPNDVGSGNTTIMGGHS